jgi:hypothetical protein
VDFARKTLASMHWIPVVVVVGETVSYNIARPVFSVWENGTCPSLARDAGPTISRLKRGFFLQNIVIQMGQIDVFTTGIGASAQSRTHSA